ncbi:MAG: GIY-YIG nuclease family protein [Sphingomonadaceae bacterium]
MMRSIEPVVYILANRKQGALYTGVTSDLLKRIYQHRICATEGFAAEHGINRLVWFEQHETMESAILREKRIKKWNRQWKIRLVEQGNPDWRDLALDLGFDPLPSLRVSE